MINKRQLTRTLLRFSVKRSLPEVDYMVLSAYQLSAPRVNFSVTQFHIYMEVQVFGWLSGLNVFHCHHHLCWSSDGTRRG